jgi:cell shape-determining protein MreC
MVNKPAFCLAALLCLAATASFAQSGDSVVNKVTSFPMRLFGHIQSKTASLNQQLAQQTQKYLQKLQQQEQRLQKKLYGIDSNAAKKLFAGSGQQYATLLQKLQTDTGSSHQKVTGTYQPHMDSLQTALAFLQKNQSALNQPALSPSTLNQPATSVTSLTGGSAAALTTKVGANLSPEVQAKLQASISQLQALQAKMQDAAQIKGFMAQRQQQIGQYITQHASLQNVLGKPYAQMQQNMYYYSAQVRQYQAMANSPDQLEQKALAMLSRLPAFQGYMKTNSQLSSLFSLPGSSSGPQILAGLQTRNQISGTVKSQLTAAASGTTNNNNSSAAAPSVPSGLESASSQLASYKARLSQLGGGGSTIDAPNFRPNEQKTKTFLNRIMYGIDFQTTQSTYYFPTMTSIGLSLGYKLGKGNDVGIGAAMKIGWGTGFNHIAVTGQGVGLRSFVDIALKGSFSVTGGFEYNYTAPFTEYQQLRQIQYWTKSGLIGISKTVSTKSRLLKQTKLSLLWDFLSYQNVPQTEPLIFRVGYNF